MKIIRHLPLPLRLAAILLLIGLLLPTWQAGAQQANSEAALTIAELMNGLITPATNTIWGAYQLQTEAEWQAVGNAALTVIAAGELLSAAPSVGSEDNWQTYNSEMIAAARVVLSAVADQDEEALSAAGNDLLYPPCESCHQQYQSR